MHSLHENSYSSVLSICETIVLYLECCFFALMYSLSKNLQRRLKTSRHNQLTGLTQQLRRQLVWIPTCWGPNCFQVNQFYLMIVHSQSQKTVLIWENVFFVCDYDNDLFRLKQIKLKNNLTYHTLFTWHKMACSSEDWVTFLTAKNRIVG